MFSNILDHLLKLFFLFRFSSFQIRKMLSPLHEGNQMDFPALRDVLMEQMVSHFIFDLLDLLYNLKHFLIFVNRSFYHEIKYHLLPSVLKYFYFCKFSDVFVSRASLDEFDLFANFLTLNQQFYVLEVPIIIQKELLKSFQALLINDPLLIIDLRSLNGTKNHKSMPDMHHVLGNNFLWPEPPPMEPY